MEKIVEVPVEVIREVEKIVEVPVIVQREHLLINDEKSWEPMMIESNGTGGESTTTTTTDDGVKRLVYKKNDD